MKKYLICLIIGLMGTSEGAFFHKKPHDIPVLGATAPFGSEDDCQKGCTAEKCLNPTIQLTCYQNCHKYNIDLDKCFTLKSVPQDSTQANSKGNFELRKIINGQHPKTLIPIKSYFGDVASNDIKVNKNSIGGEDLKVLKQVINTAASSCINIINAYKQQITQAHTKIAEKNKTFSSAQITNQVGTLDNLKDTHSKVMEFSRQLKPEMNNGDIRKIVDEKIHLALKTCFNQGESSLYEISQESTPALRNKNQVTYEKNKRTIPSTKFLGRIIKNGGAKNASCTKKCQSPDLCTNKELQKWCLAQCSHKKGRKSGAEKSTEKLENQVWDWEKIWNNYCTFNMPENFKPHLSQNK